MTDSFRRSFGGSNPVFACGICQRNTRRTNQGNQSLCPECDEWSMTENGITDGIYDAQGLAEAEAYILKKKREAIAKGGSAQRLGVTPC